MEAIYWRRLERLRHRQSVQESRLDNQEARIAQALALLMNLRAPAPAPVPAPSKDDSLTRMAKIIAICSTIARGLFWASPYLAAAWLMIWAVIRPMLLWLWELARWGLQWLLA